MNDSSEYLPHDQNTEKQKKFTLSPAIDDITFKVIQTRLDVTRNKDLSYSARLLFVLLLDLAMSPYTYLSRGVVVISVTKISEQLGCCRSSVFNWISELIGIQAVWLSKQFMPNFWAMNMYHITCLDPRDQPRQLPTRDGLWGNGARRPEAPPGTGARARWSKNVDANGLGDFSNVQQNAPVASNSVDATGLNSMTDTSKVYDGPSQTLIRAGVRNGPGSHKKLHATRAKNLAGLVQKPAHLIPSRIETKKEIKGGEGSHPPEKSQEMQLEEWRKSLKGEFRSKLQKQKQRLIAQRDSATAENVRAVISRKIKILNEELDGPTPEPDKAASRPARRMPEPKDVELSEDELLEGALYAAYNAPKTLTAAQKALLHKNGRHIA